MTILPTLFETYNPTASLLSLVFGTEISMGTRIKSWGASAKSKREGGERLGWVFWWFFFNYLGVGGWFESW